MCLNALIRVDEYKKRYKNNIHDYKYCLDQFLLIQVLEKTFFHLDSTPQKKNLFLFEKIPLSYRFFLELSLSCLILT